MNKAKERGFIVEEKSEHHQNLFKRVENEMFKEVQKGLHQFGTPLPSAETTRQAMKDVNQKIIDVVVDRIVNNLNDNVLSSVDGSDAAPEELYVPPKEEEMFVAPPAEMFVAPGEGDIRFFDGAQEVSVPPKDVDENHEIALGELRKSIEGLDEMMPELEKSAQDSKAKLEAHEKARSESTGSDVDMLNTVKEMKEVAVKRRSLIEEKRASIEKLDLTRLVETKISDDVKKSLEQKQDDVQNVDKNDENEMKEEVAVKRPSIDLTKLVETKVRSYEVSDDTKKSSGQTQDDVQKDDKADQKQAKAIWEKASVDDNPASIVYSASLVTEESKTEPEPPVPQAKSALADLRKSLTAIQAEQIQGLALPANPDPNFDDERRNSRLSISSSQRLSLTESAAEASKSSSEQSGSEGSAPEELKNPLTSKKSISMMEDMRKSLAMLQGGAPAVDTNSASNEASLVFSADNDQDKRSDTSKKTEEAPKGALKVTGTFEAKKASIVAANEGSVTSIVLSASDGKGARSSVMFADDEEQLPQGSFRNQGELKAEYDCLSRAMAGDERPPSKELKAEYDCLSRAMENNERRPSKELNGISVVKSDEGFDKVSSVASKLSDEQQGVAETLKNTIVAAITDVARDEGDILLSNRRSVSNLTAAITASLQDADQRLSLQALGVSQENMNATRAQQEDFIKTAVNSAISDITKATSGTVILSAVQSAGQIEVVGREIINSIVARARVGGCSSVTKSATVETVLSADYSEGDHVPAEGTANKIATSLTQDGDAGYAVPNDDKQDSDQKQSEKASVHDKSASIVYSASLPTEQSKTEPASSEPQVRQAESVVTDESQTAPASSVPQAESVVTDESKSEPQVQSAPANSSTAGEEVAKAAGFLGHFAPVPGAGKDDAASSANYSEY